MLKEEYLNLVGIPLVDQKTKVSVSCCPGWSLTPVRGFCDKEPKVAADWRLNETCALYFSSRKQDFLAGPSSVLYSGSLSHHPSMITFWHCWPELQNVLCNSKDNLWQQVIGKTLRNTLLWLWEQHKRQQGNKFVQNTSSFSLSKQITRGKQPWSRSKPQSLSAIPTIPVSVQSYFTKYILPWRYSRGLIAKFLCNLMETKKLQEHVWHFVANHHAVSASLNPADGLLHSTQQFAPKDSKRTQKTMRTLLLAGGWKMSRSPDEIRRMSISKPFLALGQRIWRKQFLANANMEQSAVSIRPLNCESCVACSPLTVDESEYRKRWCRRLVANPLRSQVDSLTFPARRTRKWSLKLGDS